MTDTLTQISNGMPGEPLPYQLQSDSMVTIIMLLCLITVSIISLEARNICFKN